MGLDAIEILLEVDRDFGIKIPDDESENLLTMADLRDSIVKHLLADQANLEAHLPRLVFEHLRTIVSEQMGIKRAKIHPDSNFVEDLGVT